jgi:hypothetical protein
VHTHLYACLYAFPWPLLRRKPFLHTFHLPPELENRRFLRRIISKALIGMKVMSPVAISHQNQKFLAQYYGLPVFSGSDNHHAGAQKIFGGMQSDSPIKNEQDFIERYRRGELRTVRIEPNVI